MLPNLTRLILTRSDLNSWVTSQVIWHYMELFLLRQESTLDNVDIFFLHSRLLGHGLNCFQLSRQALLHVPLCLFVSAWAWVTIEILLQL